MKMLLEFRSEDILGMIERHIRSKLPFRLVEGEVLQQRSDGSFVATIETKSVGDLIEDNIKIDEYSILECAVAESEGHIEGLNADIQVLETDIGMFKTKLNELAHILDLEGILPEDEASDAEGWQEVAEVISTKMRRVLSEDSPSSDDQIRQHVM